MNVIFRADASLDIGTGHVMRCLTLADALRERGARCHFICRQHSGHLMALIEQRGYRVSGLPMAAAAATPAQDEAPAHAAWLGATQEEDAAASLSALEPSNGPVDWLVVDHYALDARWERLLRPICPRLMVIDDLADRPHDCDVLVDQTLGRNTQDYRPWVSESCRLLCGSQYALLRPDFSALRTYSLKRRAQPQLRNILVAMGGVDKNNATGKVLAALKMCALPSDCEITVVLGPTAPWLDDVERQAQSLPWPTHVRVGVSDMAQLMANSDVAIGASGATSWERCCLGVPAIMVVLAENQRLIARALSDVGAAHLVDLRALQSNPLIVCARLKPNWLSTASTAAAAITDGSGVPQVINCLLQQGKTCE